MDRFQPRCLRCLHYFRRQTRNGGWIFVHKNEDQRGKRPFHVDCSGLIGETAELALAAVICDVITHTKISQYRFRINRDVTCDSISGGSLLCLGYRCSGRVGVPSTLLSSTSRLSPRLGVVATGCTVLRWSRNSIEIHTAKLGQVQKTVILGLS